MRKTKSSTDVVIHQWKLVASLMSLPVMVTVFAFTTFQTKSEAEDAHASIQKNIQSIEVSAEKIEQSFSQTEKSLQKLCLLFEASLKESQHPYKRRSSICSE